MFSTSAPPAPSLPKHSTQPNLLPCELPPALETIPPLRTEACVRLIEISHAVMVSP